MGACSEVKLNRMGQAVQSTIRVESSGLAQLVLSLKCLELAHKVELGFLVFFFSSYLLDQRVRWSHANIRSPAVRLAKGRPSVKSDLSKAWNHQPRAF